MPRFLEEKLKKEYGADSKIPYKVMNKLGVMKGNKETPKGKREEKKHEADEKKREVASKMVPKGHRQIPHGPNAGLSYISPKHG